MWNFFQSWSRRRTDDSPFWKSKRSGANQSQRRNITTRKPCRSFVEDRDVNPDLHLLAKINGYINIIRRILQTNCVKKSDQRSQRYRRDESTRIRMWPVAISAWRYTF
ncbi:unnamed protein product [Nezara viridula]|uniref:Uncharacterized protein n=1 Tax=Nezara viridula TaxID=85310 RepID=A0A9P0H261_NEZVI|nr:unnamed protein product [Nezara viridula]